jgi:hypothetical protein
MPLSWVKRKFHAPKNPPVHDLGELERVRTKPIKETKKSSDKE